MGFIPQITCRRCGCRYSALRHRCPSCGTRRVQQSGRIPGTTPSAVKGTPANERAADNRKWQLIFGAILLLAVIIAMIVMISVSLKDADGPDKPFQTPPPATAEPTPPPAPTPTPTPTPEVSKITIYWYTEERTEFTANVGDQTPLNASVYPLDIDVSNIKWSTSDDTILNLNTTSGKDVTVTGLRSGWVTLYAECFGVKAECRIYIKG